MIFKNPDVLKNIDDVIIGGVDVEGEEICYLNYKREVEKNILKLVTMQVRETMADGMSHIDALQDTADIVYQYLNVVDKLYPQNEEEIVQEIMKSDEFKSWDANIYYRFMSFEYKSTPSTPISVQGKYDGQLEEEISYAEEHNFYDLLLALSAAFNY
jgi:hypothetical protein